MFATSSYCATIKRFKRLWISLAVVTNRSEEHTSELQSQSNLVCRLLLEKKKNDLYLAGTLLKHMFLNIRLEDIGNADHRSRFIHGVHTPSHKDTIGARARYSLNPNLLA